MRLPVSTRALPELSASHPLRLCVPNQEGLGLLQRVGIQATSQQFAALWALGIPSSRQPRDAVPKRSPR